MVVDIDRGEHRSIKSALSKVTFTVSIGSKQLLLNKIPLGIERL
jgi:hypothetical protein